MKIIYSLLQGLQLGGITMLLSSIIDNTISQKETIDLIKKDCKLYIEGLHANYINLLIVGPIYYVIVYNCFLDNNKLGFILGDYLQLVFIHNLFYYIAHFSMHKVFFMKFIHDFHHRFKETIPSTGNAVSMSEFNFAYVIPFVIGCLWVVPNNITLKMSVGTISLLNTFIHTPNFKHIPYSMYLVSPSNHLKHHENRSGTYSAPLLNIDYFMKETHIYLIYLKELLKLKINYFMKNDNYN
jgi:hypothetical protein